MQKKRKKMKKIQKKGVQTNKFVLKYYHPKNNRVCEIKEL